MGGSNGPWRGHFGSGFEGGMRAPAIVRWPGKVHAARSPTRSSAPLNGCRRSRPSSAKVSEVPTDRPIDGIDTSSFLLGNSATNGRDHVIYFGSDAEVMSVKWKTMKVVLRHSNSTSGPIIMPQWPYIYDLVDDPVEEWDMVEKSLQGAWVMRPVAERLGALMKSMAKYPIIKPGQEFTGY